MANFWERSKEYACQVSDEIIEQIKAGVAPWQKPWKPGEKCTPENFSTGKSYTGGNSLYLMSRGIRQGHGDNRWGTYGQIEAAGGHVRKGERGTKVLFYTDRARTPAKDEAGKPLQDKAGKQVYQEYQRAHPLVRQYTVFNVEQADGLNLPSRTAHAPPEWQAHREADRLIRASGVAMSHVAGDRAYYNMHQDKVVLPEREQFPTANAYYQTAMHELGHATGHPERMDRESLKEGLDKGFGSPEYAREELRAEISAMMTGERVGVGHDPKRGAAYVENWVKVLEEDPREIHRAAGEAQCMSDYLVGRTRTREAPGKEQKDGLTQQYSHAQGPQISHTPSPTPQQGKELQRDTGPSR